MSGPAGFATPLVRVARPCDRLLVGRRAGWDIAKGPTTELNYATGVTTYHPGDVAGAQSISQTVSLGAILEY